MATDPRRLYWDACLNVRDLGGFPTRDGHTTRSHAVVRADNLCRLTAQGRAALIRYGVRTAIDFRDPREYPLEHDPFSRDELGEVGRVGIPLLTPGLWRAWHSGIDGHEGELLFLETCGEPVAMLFHGACGRAGRCGRDVLPAGKGTGVGARAARLEHDRGHERPRPRRVEPSRARRAAHRACPADRRPRPDDHRH